MITQLLQILDKIGIYLLCMCIPGILFVLDGIRIIRSKSALSVGRDSHFRWKKPKFIYGKSATRFGKTQFIFGIGLFILGVFVIYGELQ